MKVEVHYGVYNDKGQRVGGNTVVLDVLPSATNASIERMLQSRHPGREIVVESVKER
ncbi:MAG: hypothetical protein IKQ16_00075 [Lentisphaeria bacterium]|nr:hypothetical protein [Lentisphaeria bacterium]